MSTASCCAVAALIVALVGLDSAPAAAQDLSNGSSENYERVWFVPRLGGAVSFEGGLMSPLGGASDFPTTWFAGLGWKHYLEGHGRLQLRWMATYEHGGVLNPRVEGTANRVGASFAVTARGITQDWFFGQLTALVDASYVNLRRAPDPFAGIDDTFHSGWQVGFGLETTFGSMFVLDPYLMAETGASVTFSHLSLGGADTWEVWARWIARFDIGVRNAEK